MRQSISTGLTHWEIKDYFNHFRLSGDFYNKRCTFLIIHPCQKYQESDWGLCGLHICFKAAVTAKLGRITYGSLHVVSINPTFSTLQSRKDDWADGNASHWIYAFFSKTGSFHSQEQLIYTRAWKGWILIFLAEHHAHIT